MASTASYTVYINIYYCLKDSSAGYTYEPSESIQFTTTRSDTTGIFKTAAKTPSTVTTSATDKAWINFSSNGNTHWYYWNKKYYPTYTPKTGEVWYSRNPLDASCVLTSSTGVITCTLSKITNWEAAVDLDFSKTFKIYLECNSTYASNWNNSSVSVTLYTKEQIGSRVTNGNKPGYSLDYWSFLGEEPKPGETVKYYGQNEPAIANWSPASVTWKSIADTTLTYGESGSIDIAKASALDGTMTYAVDGTWPAGITLNGTKIEITNTTAAGTHEVKVKATCSETGQSATTPVKIIINKVAASWTAQPTAKTGLKYTEATQELITNGTSSTGTPQYSLDGKTYSTSIPKGTNPGTYTVYYMVKGDSNHNDTSASTLSASIANGTLSATATATSATYTGSEQYATIKSGIAGTKIVSGTSTSYGNTVVESATKGTSYNLKPGYTDYTNGSKTIYYKVTKQYYDDLTGSTTINITKANIATYTAPIGVSGAIWSGSAQSLLKTTGKGPTGTKFKYKINGTSTWVDDPKATDAGDYTVNYYIEGGTNYNSLGSATKPLGSFTASIAQNYANYVYADNAWRQVTGMWVYNNGWCPATNVYTYDNGWHQYDESSKQQLIKSKSTKKSKASK